MGLKPSDIGHVQAACGVLAAMLAAPAVRERFPNARLLRIQGEIEKVSDELPSTLLPFMLEEQSQSADIYAFDSEDDQRNRVVVWNDHAIVADWHSFDAFLDWLGASRP